jgi:hypothetical protein
LAEVVADEDPFTTLRLLQVYGVQRFGHIIIATPPPLVSDFALQRDEVVTATFAEYQHETRPLDSTHSLPIGAGGASLASLDRHTSVIYLVAFFRVGGPLRQRPVAMGGSTNRVGVAELVDPVNESDIQKWETYVCGAHADALAL